MNPSNGISEANVEDMSNAELFQFLFKAELGADLPESLTDSFLQEASSPSSLQEASSPSSLHEASSPSSTTASTIASSPYASLSSPSPSSHESSPATSTISYSSPPQPQLFQPLLQPYITTSTPLPSSMFSYRQLTPNMPPPMPTQLDITSHSFTTTTNADSHSLSQSNSTASSDMLPPGEMAIWMQRFQQLQQQQHNFLNLSATSQNQLGGRFEPSLAISPSTSTSTGPITIKSENNIIYPSPPMKDDMSMDSDSDDSPNREDNNDAESLKPSAYDLKKMTSKERRQLRNKLSARNFRVRRKEYITSLENQVKEARREASELQKKLNQSELNCQFLRQELEASRLSQTLFNDGKMSKDHANLLASLLNPNTESFPTTSADTSLASMQLQQQKELMDSINDNNMTILNNSLTITQPSTSTSNASNGSLQPFVPFDGNWELIINRAEMVIDPVLDPKDVQSKEATYESLFAQYEAAKREADIDEHMRTELKAYHEQRLAQTYIVMPKDESILSASNKANQDNLILQTMVYMMMLHLTRSLFEAATLSKAQLVNVYQTMDEPLRARMGQEQQQRHPCMFREWREGWMRKHWPSFYNNRQRVCELLKNGLCPSASTSSEIDVDETVRKMEEGVKDKTIEPQPVPLCVWVRNYLASWLRCHRNMATEEREALISGSSMEATA
ncbi:hypothetical protein BGZ49_009652 [Haplosporangium sp. Z 27]|nr:hypothetical protein BGZ49_009652 [Haplosporangium sp. Z 27]